MTRIAAAWMSENFAPGLDRLHARLLRGIHRVVDLALRVGEGAVDREGAGDVGGEERVDLDPGVEEDQVASRTSPVFLIQCRVLAWSPAAQIES
jgi:hypothetical protein